MTAHILMIEDEMIILDLLSTFLEKSGYRVSTASAAQNGLTLVREDMPDLVLLDLGLPDEDGLVVIRKLRAFSAVPIIVLSARNENDQRIAALELGANDYVSKGVNPQELLIRIRNVLFPATQGDERAAVDFKPNLNESQFAGWTLHYKKRELNGGDGKIVHLTNSEYLVLSALARRPGHVVPRSTLLEAVSGIDETPLDRSIDTYISRLRGKIEDDPKHPDIILTVKGVGYRLRTDHT